LALRRGRIQESKAAPGRFAFSRHDLRAMKDEKAPLQRFPSALKSPTQLLERTIGLIFKSRRSKYFFAFRALDEGSHASPMHRHKSKSAFAT
jgi:hypothetical protein